MSPCFQSRIGANQILKGTRRRPTSRHSGKSTDYTYLKSAVLSEIALREAASCVIAPIRRDILQRGIFVTLSVNRSVEMPKTRLLNTVAMPESRRVKLFDLEINSCRFPIGAPRDAEFSFCGQPAPGFGINPYCPTHQKIAFAKATGPSQHRSAATRLARRMGHAQSA
jgi:hypothetical protein